MIGYLLLFRLSVPYALVRRDPERALLLLLPVFHLYAQAPGAAGHARASAARAFPAPTRTRTRRVPEVPPPPAQQQDEDRLVDALGRFSETLVRDVMTPRPDIVAIACRAPVAELRRLMRENKYSRIPVYGENLDDILGVVEVRDLLDFEGARGDARHQARAPGAPGAGHQAHRRSCCARCRAATSRSPS